MVKRPAFRERIYLILADWTFTAFRVNRGFQSRLIGLLLNIVDEHGLLKTTEIIGEKAQTNNSFAILRFILDQGKTFPQPRFSAFHYQWGLMTSLQGIRRQCQ